MIDVSEEKAECLVLPEDVWVIELVHELHLLEHVGPVRAVLVHLEHHHLPGGLVGHLKESRERDPLERGGKANLQCIIDRRMMIRHFATRHAHAPDANGRGGGRGQTRNCKIRPTLFLHSFRVFPGERTL